MRDWEKKLRTAVPVLTEVRGTPAFRGVVSGHARIVRAPRDFGNVRVGDILVTTSTTPMYVPILGKVKAIVTEEGGVLSHASVISREMKIPCVIGAKTATRVFHDGDLVEVDAERGIVRKLSAR